LRMGNGGVDSGASDYSYNRMDMSSASGSFSTVNDTTNYLALTGNNYFSSQGDLHLRLINPLLGKRAHIHSNYTGIAFGVLISGQTWGSRNTDKVINTIQLYSTSGNFNTGTYRLYGFK
jgi:hypothetical protein